MVDGVRATASDGECLRMVDLKRTKAVWTGHQDASINAVIQSCVLIQGAEYGVRTGNERLNG